MRSNAPGVNTKLLGRDDSHPPSRQTMPKAAPEQHLSAVNTHHQQDKVISVNFLQTRLFLQQKGRKKRRSGQKRSRDGAKPCSLSAGCLRDPHAGPRRGTERSCTRGAEVSHTSPARQSLTCQFKRR